MPVGKRLTDTNPESGWDLHPGKLREAPNLIYIGESLPWFFPGCYNRAPWQKYNWECLLGIALWVSLSSHKFVQIMSVKKLWLPLVWSRVHSLSLAESALSCDILSIPSICALFFLVITVQLILNSLGFCNWTWNILYRLFKFKIQMLANCSGKNKTWFHGPIWL